MRFALVVVAAVALVGCSKSGPTYAELLQVYTNERIELDRLQAMRTDFSDGFNKSINASESFIRDLKNGPVIGAGKDAAAIAETKKMIAETEVSLKKTILQRDEVLGKLDKQIEKQKVRFKVADKARDEAGPKEGP